MHFIIGSNFLCKVSLLLLLKEEVVFWNFKFWHMVSFEPEERAEDRAFTRNRSCFTEGGGYNP